MKEFGFGLTVGIVSGIIIFSLILQCFPKSTVFYRDGVKDGQISAINGNIKYQLVTNPDKTTSWKEIEKK